MTGIDLKPKGELDLDPRQSPGTKMKICQGPTSVVFFGYISKTINDVKVKLFVMGLLGLKNHFLKKKNIFVGAKSTPYLGYLTSVQN